MAGLRRNEIDKLEWSAFRWEKGLIRIEATRWFHPKSEDSIGDVEVDPELVELFRGYRAKAKGSFVIESSNDARPDATYDHYRCQSCFEKLAEWLRERALSQGLHFTPCAKNLGPRFVIARESTLHPEHFVTPTSQ